MPENWISVGQELPKYGQPVLLRSHQGVVQQQAFYRDGYDDQDDWWQDCADEADPVEINAGDSWMPWPAGSTN